MSTETLGAIGGDLVTIVDSTSGLDSTIFPIEGKLNVNLEPSGGEQVLIDLSEINVVGINVTEDGPIKVDYQSKSNGIEPGTFYIVE